MTHATEGGTAVGLPEPNWTGFQWFHRLSVQQAAPCQNDNSNFGSVTSLSRLHLDRIMTAV